MFAISVQRRPVADPVTARETRVPFGTNSYSWPERTFAETAFAPTDTESCIVGTAYLLVNMSMAKFYKIHTYRRVAQNACAPLPCPVGLKLGRLICRSSVVFSLIDVELWYWPDSS